MEIAAELKEKFPERFYTTNFERVQRDPITEFNRVLHFLGLEEGQRDVISFIKVYPLLIIPYMGGKGGRGV